MRAVRGAALAVLAASAITGCGAESPVSRPDPRVRLAAAVLSQEDVPGGYLPAGDQPVFAGVNTGDPHCRVLLELADVRGGPGVPYAWAAFYSLTPGASLAERILRLPPGKAVAHVAKARSAAEGCASIPIQRGGPALLRRLPLRPPAPRDSLAVRYAGDAGGFRVHYDIVMAGVSDHLLVLAHPGVCPDPASTVTEQVFARALRKLGGAAAAPAPAATP
jgi:hypothetical protein